MMTESTEVEMGSAATATEGTATAPSTSTKPLADIEKQDLDNEGGNQNRNRELERNFFTKLWQGLAIACFALNIVAMAIQASAVSIIAGILFALPVSVAVFYFQMQLQDTDST